MSALVVVALLGVLLMLVGALLGATFEDMVHEGQRRRLAHQRRELNARWRALENRGTAFELALPSHHVIMPVAFDDSD